MAAQSIHARHTCEYGSTDLEAPVPHTVLDCDARFCIVRLFQGVLRHMHCKDECRQIIRTVNVCCGKNAWRQEQRRYKRLTCMDMCLRTRMPICMYVHSSDAWASLWPWLAVAAAKA